MSKRNVKHILNKEYLELIASIRDLVLLKTEILKKYFMHNLKLQDSSQNERKFNILP